MPVGCYAVIFSSHRSDDDQGYAEMAATMVRLATQQKGFLGMESVRDATGRGITVSFWESREDIARWKEDAAHREAQRLGKERWYQSFHLRIAKVVEDRAWPAEAE